MFSQKNRWYTFLLLVGLILISGLTACGSNSNQNTSADNTINSNPGSGDSNELIQKVDITVEPEVGNVDLTLFSIGYLESGYMQFALDCDYSVA